MKLYFAPGACSLAARIVINESGLPCEFEQVDLKAKKTKSGQDYYQVNFKGAVPALQLDNGEVLTENAVIQQYVAETAHKENLLPKAGDPKRYRYLEWLNFVATDLHKGLGIMFDPNLTQEAKDKVAIPNAKKKLGFVDKHLATHKYLLGDEFSLADAYLFVMLLWTANLHLPVDEFKNLQRYFKELTTRPAIQKALREEGLEKALS